MGNEKFRDKGDTNKSMTLALRNVQVNQDLFYRLAYGHRAKICKYFLKYPFGLSMLRQLSENELLFLMPNNAKRRLGLPMTRVAKRGRRALDYKRKRRQALAYHHVYVWVEKMFEDQISKEFDRIFGNIAEV